MQSLARYALVFALSFTTGESALAQLAQYNGFATGDSFGHSVATGRMNRDRFEEVVIGAPTADPEGREDAGSVYVYSARHGHLIARLDGEAAEDQFGWSVVVRDLNRDGSGDLIVGAPFADPNGWRDAGSVYVYSGRDFRLLRRLDGKSASSLFGYSLACGDVNGDKRDDLIIGAPAESRNLLLYSGSVHVFSGRKYRWLYRFNGETKNFAFGGSVACGDVNGDGYADVVAGARENPGSSAGSVFVFSGKGGGLLRRLNGAAIGDSFGVSVACGDVRPDGRIDLIIGAPSASPNGIPGAGSVFVYSGKDFTLLRRLDGTTTGGAFGYDVTVRDVDLDRRADVIVGAPGANHAGLIEAGTVFLYSGRRLLLAKYLDGRDAGGLLGRAVACGDVNGDGRPDVIAGAPRTGVFGLSEVGSVFAFSGRL